MSALVAVPDLPLVPFLSQSPDALASIDVDHPDGQSELKHGTPHPKQAVPERIGRGQHISNLQEGDWDLESGASKGNEHEPEDPAPMAHDPKAEQGDQHENADQEQRHWNRIAVSRRGRERERLGVDRRISEIHHHQAEGSEHEKGDHAHLQAHPDGRMRRCLHSCVVSFPGCRPSNSREVRTSGSSSQRWAITSSPSNWSVSRPKSRPAMARTVRGTSMLRTCPAPRCAWKERSATVKVGTRTCW